MRKTQQTEFSLGLKWSIIGHLILLLCVLVQNLIFPDNPVRYIPTLKVDLVGLPDVLKKDLKIPQQVASDKQQTKPEAPSAKPVALNVSSKKEALKEVDKTNSQPSTQTIEKKNKYALDRIKALAKITDTFKDTSGEDHTHVTKSAPLKGNKLSPGTSLSGEAKEAQSMAYFDLLRDRLQHNWTLPPWIARQNFAAQVQIYIDAHGRVRNYHFVKPSGSSPFDEAIKKTLEQSQPFPIPPQSYQATLISEGVLIGFPL